ncbi:hypothetical protein SAZ11_51350 [Streptomyces sp. FXJ1.4098]|nr:hypothetical protein [Streptomyces sp. FXJ1.4098]
MSAALCCAATVSAVAVLSSSSKCSWDTPVETSTTAPTARPAVTGSPTTVDHTRRPGARPRSGTRVRRAKVSANPRCAVRSLPCVLPCSSPLGSDTAASF